MAKRITLKDVKHVDFVPSDFIAEIASNPDWTATDIGCYFVLCLHLYINGGKLEFDPQIMSKLCRTNPENFEKSWKRVCRKFQKSEKECEENGKKVKTRLIEINQRRVLKELRASRNRMQTSVNAGVKGAKKRWGGFNDPNNNPNSNPNAKRNETKRNEDDTILNETKRNEEPSDSDSVKNSIRSTLRFADQLDKTIKPFSKSDRTALTNLCKWLQRKITHKQFSENIFNVVLGYAAEAKTGRKPIAVFFSKLKQEMGYQGQE